MSSAFIQAAVILLREGLEAMLVIAALAGYLTKAGAGHRIQALYGGALAAVAASIVAAWLFAVLNSGEHSDIMEGIIILFAASLMLYVSGWLMVKQDPRGGQAFEPGPGVFGQLGEREPVWIFGKQRDQSAGRTGQPPFSHPGLPRP